MDFRTWPWLPNPSSLLAGEDALARTLPRASVRVRALTAHRKTATMTQAAIATEVHQTLDVHLDLATQVAFDLVVRVDDLADAAQLGFIQAVSHLVRRDLCSLADVRGSLRPDTEQVAERNRDVLTTGKVYA